MYDDEDAEPWACLGPVESNEDIAKAMLAFAMKDIEAQVERIEAEHGIMPEAVKDALKAKVREVMLPQYREQVEQVRSTKH